MYYPKSQIKPNLYTNGGEFILSTTKEDYKGNYYKVSSGKSYSGKNPTDKPNILLLLIPHDPNEEFVGVGGRKDMPITFDFAYNQSPQNVRFIPIFNLTLPTDQDIQNGQFNRYFCKKTNELKYLYTSGGEFTTKNGQNYIGFYHIHKGTIPMAGKTHTQYFHETLIPTQLSLNKNSKFSEILASIALIEALPANSNIDNPNNLNNIITPDNPTFSLTEALGTKFLTKQDPLDKYPDKPDQYK